MLFERAAIKSTLEKLRGIAEANAEEFRRSPEMRARYGEALESGRFRYVPDEETCGQPDCWVTARELLERYCGEPSGEVCDGIILADCQRLACALSGYLSLFEPAYIGLVPPQRSGSRVAHAVTVLERDENLVIVDPSIDAGMTPLPNYAKAYALRVRAPLLSTD